MGGDSTVLNMYFDVTIVMLIIVKKINSYGLVEIAYYWRRMGRFFQ